MVTIDNPLPRAYLTTNWRVVKNENDAENQSLYKSSGVYGAAAVEDKTGQVSDSNSANANIVPLAIDIYKDDYVKIIETSKISGLLVLNDTYYPDWKVYINGKESIIYQTNYLFRGVFVKPGENVIEFVYNPKLLTESLAVSVITLIIIYAYSIFRSLQERGKIINESDEK